MEMKDPSTSKAPVWRWICRV